MVSLVTLESHLVDKSYIEGYAPSQADVVVYKVLGSAPGSDHPNALRWYNHITSYAEEHSTLPGDGSKSATDYFPEASTSAPPKPKADDDDDVDLFGSDDEEEDAEAEKLKAQRLAEYHAKKALKPKTIAKSLVTLDVKPWDDETPMDKLEECVRSIHKDGLVWGLSTLVAVGYGVKKLQISLVVEDEKVSLEDLQEEIAEFEDYVQSTDVQAMQKL